MAVCLPECGVLPAREAGETDLGHHAEEVGPLCFALQPEHSMHGASVAL